MDDEMKMGCGAIVAVVVLFSALVGWSVFKNNIYGNKQFIDMKTRFNTAYIMADGGKFEKHRIVAWKDWDNSDSVQVVLPDGRAIYTHLCNVKLTNE